MRFYIITIKTGDHTSDMQCIISKLLAGSTPYPGMGAREVMRRVRDGYRLERPSHCHPDLYKIIAKCWAGDMNKRPDFSELRQVSWNSHNL